MTTSQPTAWALEMIADRLRTAKFIQVPGLDLCFWKLWLHPDFEVQQSACGCSWMNLGYQSPTPQLPPARLQINLLRDGVSVCAASRACVTLRLHSEVWTWRGQKLDTNVRRGKGSKSATGAGSKRTCCQHPRNGRREKFAGHPILG